MTGPGAECSYCASEHHRDFLCDPARRVLDSLVERGMSFNRPTLEFPAPYPVEELGLGHTDVLLRQFMVHGATVEAVGIPRPALIFTGRDGNGAPLPRWMYVGTSSQMRDVIQLVTDMGRLAIRTAARSG